MRSCRLHISLVLMLGLFVSMLAGENMPFTIVCINQAFNQSGEGAQSSSNDTDTGHQVNGQVGSVIPRTRSKCFGGMVVDSAVHLVTGGHDLLG